MLEKIVEAAKNKKIKLSTHAMLQAAERKISTQDIIMIKKDIRILTVLIKNVLHQDSGAYGETVDINVYSQCEKIAVRAIIENDFEFTDKEVHLFRSVLGLTLKEFGNAFSMSDAAVLKWEKGNKIPQGQKILIKAFMRHNLGLIPVSYPVLAKFKEPELVEVEYYSEEDLKRAHAA